jgi:hypothetical protein
MEAVYMTDKEKIKARVEKLYREKYLPMYLLFISVYPFTIEDLDGEIWRDISGYENLYQESNFGRSRRCYKNGKIKILKPWINRQGYLIVDLCKNGKSKHFHVHRLVAQTFIPNPENKPEPNHEDGNKFNNHVSNLKWVTKSENIQHAMDNGLNHSGENSCKAKLTNEQAKWIREVYIKGDPEFGAGALARKFNMTHSTILDIIHGRSYKNAK